MDISVTTEILIWLGLYVFGGGPIVYCIWSAQKIHDEAMQENNHDKAEPEKPR